MDGSYIRRVRKDLDLTQEAFGNLLGVHWVTISRWESAAQPQEPTPYQAAMIKNFAKAVRSRGPASEKPDTDKLKELLGDGLVIAAVALLLVAVFKE